MTYIEQHPKLPTKTTFSTFTEKDYSYILTFILLNVSNQFTLNQGQEKPYISQLKLFKSTFST